MSQPTEEQINDWNIHNDHQGDAEDGHADGEAAMLEDATAKFPIGTKVRVIQAIERFPDFIVPVGEMGVVQNNDLAIFSVKLDKDLPGVVPSLCEVEWYPDQIADIPNQLEIIAAETFNDFIAETFGDIPSNDAQRSREEILIDLTANTYYQMGAYGLSAVDSVALVRAIREAADRFETQHKDTDWHKVDYMITVDHFATALYTELDKAKMFQLGT